MKLFIEVYITHTIRQTHTHTHMIGLL